MIVDLFYGNFIILYFIFGISVIVIDRLNERQKVAIIYLCTYALTWDSSISKKLLEVSLTIMIFLILEFFTSDEKKMLILKRMHYKIADFLYMGVFQYKIWAPLTAIAIRSGFVMQYFSNYKLIVNIISIVFFSVGLT
ncbi:MAG: hypothetical protein IJM28_01365, partial [Lachnospiraceae bacterium]|nr:hypothetical protein [Lachnospiraceae bacterium]